LELICCCFIMINSNLALNISFFDEDKYFLLTSKNIELFKMIFLAKY